MALGCDGRIIPRSCKSHDLTGIASKSRDGLNKFSFLLGSTNLVESSNTPHWNINRRIQHVRDCEQVYTAYRTTDRCTNFNTGASAYTCERNIIVRV